MEGLTMLWLPQIVRRLATLALAGGITAAGAQAPVATPAPATGQAKSTKVTKLSNPKASSKVSRSPRSSAKSGAAPAAQPNLPVQERRDPFAPLISKEQTGPSIPAHLPPGKAGLMVSTLRVDGVVRGANGMLVLVSNPQQRVYFLRQGDRLYDGVVEQISMDAVSFKETGKDPFGKPIERIVTKRIYPSAGE